MDARTLSINTIFGQDRWHVVPLYQRPYVWKQAEQWEPLWEDIRKVAERTLNKQEAQAHFMGAIVLEQMHRSTGHIDTRQIIDGQQRLTTIQIILEAFCDYCKVIGADKHHRALQKLTRNDDPMSQDVDEKYKVWPTNVDRENYRSVMDCESPDELRAKYKAKPDVWAVGHPIADGYLYFYSVISAWLQPDQIDFNKRLDALLFAMREGLRMVVIDLEKEDDPQVIFETLNARGTPLLPSDLVKNFLFHKAARENEALDPLYERTWKPFDKNSNYWRAQVGRGHAQRARLDLFLQHYLTAKLRDDVALPHLYTQFCQFTERTGRAQATLESVTRYAEIYQGFDAATPGSRAQLFFQRLAIMDLGTAYPFLLALYADHAQDTAQVDAILDDVESFLIRRMVCQLNTRGYNTLFLALLKALSEDGGTPHGRVRNMLISGDAESTRWPDDDEFERAWLNVPVYRIFTVARTRMLLEALERQMRTDKSEKIVINEKLTVEHLLPQAWEEHWPLQDISSEDINAMKAQRNEILHTMGNLTLLTKALNPSISNGAWDHKITQITENSVLVLNHKLARYCDSWDESTIRRRGKELFAEARMVWPYPAK